MSDDKERKEEETFEVIVEDKRISRELIESLDSEEEGKAEAAGETAEQPKAEKQPAPEAGAKEAAKKETPPSPPPTAGGQPSSEAEEAIAESQRVLEMIVQSGIEGVLLGALQQAVILAQIYLGMVPNPRTRMVERDPARASLAIDYLDWVIARLGPSLTPQERSELTTLVNQFRQRFVESFTPPAGGPPGVGEGAGPDGN